MSVCVVQKQKCRVSMADKNSLPIKVCKVSATDIVWPGFSAHSSVFAGRRLWVQKKKEKKWWRPVQIMNAVSVFIRRPSACCWVRRSWEYFDGLLSSCVWNTYFCCVWQPLCDGIEMWCGRGYSEKIQDTDFHRVFVMFFSSVCHWSSLWILNVLFRMNFVSILRILTKKNVPPPPRSFRVRVRLQKEPTDKSTVTIFTSITACCSGFFLLLKSLSLKDFHKQKPQGALNFLTMNLVNRISVLQYAFIMRSYISPKIYLWIVCFSYKGITLCQWFICR